MMGYGANEQWVCFLLTLEGMVHTEGQELADTGLLVATKWLPS